jgi:hypothetical protein
VIVARILASFLDGIVHFPADINVHGIDQSIMD